MRVFNNRIRYRVLAFLNLVATFARVRTRQYIITAGLLGHFLLPLVSSYSRWGDCGSFHHKDFYLLGKPHFFRCSSAPERASPAAQAAQTPFPGQFIVFSRRERLLFGLGRAKSI
jgi:hypothetical protein